MAMPCELVEREIAASWEEWQVIQLVSSTATYMQIDLNHFEQA